MLFVCIFREVSECCPLNYKDEVKKNLTSPSLFVDLDPSTKVLIPVHSIPKIATIPIKKFINLDLQNERRKKSAILLWSEMWYEPLGNLSRSSVKLNDGWWHSCRHLFSFFTFHITNPSMGLKLKLKIRIWVKSHTFSPEELHRRRSKTPSTKPRLPKWALTMTERKNDIWKQKWNYFQPCVTINLVITSQSQRNATLR